MITTAPSPSLTTTKKRSTAIEHMYRWRIQVRSLLTDLIHTLEETVIVLETFNCQDTHHFRNFESKHCETLLHEIENSLIELRKVLRSLKYLWDTYGNFQKEVSVFGCKNIA